MYFEKYNRTVGSEVSLDVNIHVMIVCVIQPCNLVSECQCFGGKCYTHSTLKMEATYVSETPVSTCQTALRSRRPQYE